jgi:hypothetical protein
MGDDGGAARQQDVSVVRRMAHRWGAKKKKWFPPEYVRFRFSLARCARTAIALGADTSLTTETKPTDQGRS